MAKEAPQKVYGEIKGSYKHKTIKERIEALFLNNLNKIIKRN